MIVRQNSKINCFTAIKKSRRISVRDFNANPINEPLVQVDLQTLNTIRETVKQKKVKSKKVRERAQSASIQEEEKVIKRPPKKDVSKANDDDNSKSSISLYKRYQIRDQSARPRNRFEKIGSRDYEVLV